MGEILNSATLGMFLFYLVPGVVATKVYRFLHPSDQQNYTDYVIELVTFSMFYFALFFWLLILINSVGVRSNPVLSNILIFIPRLQAGIMSFNSRKATGYSFTSHLGN